MMTAKDFAKYAKALPSPLKPLPRYLSEDVIFRVWRGSTGGVIALWPAEHDGFQRRNMCRSFEHFGQHGAANYGVVMARTRPAKGAEHHALLAELRQRGYSPNVIQRDTAAHRRLRNG
jgi:hypothetical protein